MSMPSQVAPIKSDNARVEIGWIERERSKCELNHAYTKWSQDFTANGHIKCLCCTLHCEKVFVLNVNCYHTELPMRNKVK